MAAYQFLGEDQVLAAFENRDAVNWSCWQGRQMLFKYDGNNKAESTEALNKWLGMMCGSKAVYTLKVYDDLQGKIKSTTPDDGSFNFKLEEETDFAERRQGYVGGVARSNPMLSVLQGVQQSLQEIKTELAKPAAAEPEEIPMWERILDHPVTGALLGKMLGVEIPMEPAGAMSGVPGAWSLEDSLAVLREQDPDIEAHLAKLARLAKVNPPQFKMLVGMLEKM